MGQQGVPTVEDMGDGIHLVFPQGDLRVHAGEIDVTSVILTGTVGVEQDVIGFADGFPALRVLPDPLRKGFLDKLLLALGDGRLLFVEDGDPPPIRVILIIKNTDILQVQAVLDDLIGVDPLGAVGSESLHIAPVFALTLNAPFAGDLGVVDFDVPLGAPGRTQRFKHELPDILRVQPCGTQPDGDLTGGEVHRLYLCQSICIDLKLRVLGRLCLGVRQLFSYIAGKVFICGQVLFIDALNIVRVQENNALQIGKQGLLVLAGELAHIGHVHMGFLPNGQSQRLHGGIHLLGGLVAADGALGKQVCLALQVLLLIQHFQRTEQEIGTVLVEGNGIATGIDKAVFPGKGIIQGIQLGLLVLDFFFGIVLSLILQQRPHTVPQLDHALDAALGGLGYLHRVHAAVFPVVDLAIHQRVGEIADSRVCFNGAVLALQFFLPVIGRDFAVDILDGVGKKAFQRLIREGRAGRLRAIRTGHHLHLTQHHVRVVDEVAVHLDAVIIGGKMYPLRLYIHHAVALLEEQNI